MIARLALLLPALVAAAPAGPGAASGYRVRLPVTPGAGSAVQRLALPAAVLAAARTRDLADVRVFDARGRALPIARVAAAAAVRRDVLRAMPILGAADALTVRGVSLQIDPGGSARVARVDGTVAQAPGRAAVLGMLFDARRVDGPASTLVLDADVPVGQPVTFAVEASRDLSTWRRIGEKVVYRASAADRSGITMPLAARMLGGDYLKVTWHLASRALSPIAVRGATLVSRPGATALAWIDAALPPLADRRAIEAAVPFATPIAAIRVVPRGEDMLVPVRILGRDDAEHPWTPLGSGVAAREGNGITLTGARFATLRIEAASPGFATAPAVRVGFAPRDILFLASDAPPFALAAGRDGEEDRYLPAASLLTQAAGRPVATAVVAAAPTRVAFAAIAASHRAAILWVALLAATALLAGLAWLLWRRGPGAAA